MHTPRGVVHHRGRRALLVADSGNHRIQVLSTPGFELEETWDGAGTLEAPQSLGVDAAGHVYVADGASGRLDKLDPRLGEPVPGFWDAVRAGGVPAAVEVTVAGEQVLVLGRDRQVHVLGTDGARERSWPTGLALPVGLAFSRGQVLVGDNASRRLVAFRPDGTLVGEANGYEGPVAAVAAAGRGGVLVHAGDSRPPLRLASTGAFRRHGVLRGGPFANPSPRSDPRHLLRAEVDRDGAGGHVQLHVLAEPGGAPPARWPDAPDPFADARWQHLPIAPDATETLLPGAVGDVLWLGVTFTGESAGSPVLSQIRIDFDHDTYLQHLPALYQRDAESSDVLARWLTLFESAFDQQQANIDDLPRRFDPAAAPEAWPSWLAGWLATELPGGWDEEPRRAAIAGAFARSARRGTVAGLRESIGAEAGMQCMIEEPVVQAGWWALPADAAPDAEVALSVLGATTMLAVGEPQGAVAGTTAILDGSFLSPQEDYAAPLFADVAHQFTVRIYRGSTFSAEAVALARRVLDRERPAHTTYHLCVVEPRMRVGLQSRIGIDAVVAGSAQPTLLGDLVAGGLMLGGAPPSRLGEATALGQTHLTGSATDG